MLLGGLDGGRFFGDSVMEVTRIDVFDFKIILTECEFNELKEVFDFDNTSYEEILLNIFECGFDVLRNGAEGKET